MQGAGGIIDGINVLCRTIDYGVFETAVILPDMTSAIRGMVSEVSSLILCFVVLPLAGCKPRSQEPISPPASRAVAMREHVLTNVNLRFEYPSDFSIGRFAPVDSAGIDDAIVLIETNVVGKADVENIKAGSLPTIFIDIQEGEAARFVRKTFCRDEFRVVLGTNLVYGLPGFPGPFGDQVFYYLYPVNEETVLEFIGHRFYFQSEGSRHTHYDAVIEDMIRSLASQ